MFRSFAYDHNLDEADWKVIEKPICPKMTADTLDHRLKIWLPGNGISEDNSIRKLEQVAGLLIKGRIARLVTGLATMATKESMTTKGLRNIHAEDLGLDNASPEG